MADLVQSFDPWLDEAGPAALVIREHLMPVEGHDGVFFPSTFAASEDKTFKGGYNIDDFGGGRNVCLVDSVGAQANRIEPLFSKPPYSGLVPQVFVCAGDRRVSLLDAGHRAGDALVRCAAGLSEDLRRAFKATLGGNVELLARIAPTSLTFGAWDSRDTQAKLPRLLASTIRAYDVRPVTRAAQYVPALEYVAAGALDEPADKAQRDAYAERGFVHVPSSGSHGGVIADGSIRRDATLHLVALRRLAGSDSSKTRALQRYVLGLALTAFTYSPSGFLRQGCNLVLDPKKPRDVSLVWPDGRREPADVAHKRAVAFARAAAHAFGINPDRKIPTAGIDREAQFDKELAKKDMTGDGKATVKAGKKRVANR
jgi:CRISPR-associated protein Csb1